MMRALRAGLMALLVVAGVLVQLVAPNEARSAPGDVLLSGHGYGHGRGLSQWGSYGYATQYGWTDRQILGHYYGGTTVSDRGTPGISVRLTALDGRAPEIWSGVDYSIGPYRIPGGHTGQISRNGDGTWKLTTRSGCGAAVTWSGPISDAGFRPYAAPNGLTDMLTVCGAERRTYRGTIGVLWDGGPRTVNYLSLEDYLRGVVPRESPASWADAPGGSQALMAQSVAARSYASAENHSRYAKTCDTTSCQVYGGAGLNGSWLEDARTNQAVTATRGQVLTRNSAVVRAEFSSSSGGYTAGGDFPAVRDDGDSISPHHNWTLTLTADQIGRAYAVGTFTDVRVLTRNGLGADGGRVLTVRISGTSGSVTVSGTEFRSTFGLKSDWFSFTGATSALRDVSPKTVSAVRTGPGTVIPFVRGTDGSVYYTVGRNGSFGAWRVLPAKTISGPASVSWDGQRIDVFVIGTDRGLWHSYASVNSSGEPAGWSPWENLGGVLTTSPAASSPAPGLLDVTARGSDGRVYHRAWTGARWTPWADLGGVAQSAPSLEVLNGSSSRVRVVGTDGQYWARTLTTNTAPSAGGWSATGWPSSMAAGVSATASWATQSHAVSLTAPDGAVRQYRQDSGQDVRLGGRTTSVVSMVTWTDGSIWTFARGADGALWLNIANAAATRVDWYRIGGQLA